MDEEMSCSTPAAIIPVPTAAAPTKSTQLKLSLPQFSGQILDWHKFWGIYEGKMDHETAHSHLEKIGCIEDAMLSDEAKDIVRQAALSKSYAKVVEALKREYDQPRPNFNHHQSKMLSLMPVKDDNKSLGEFLQATEGHIQSLRGFTAGKCFVRSLSMQMIVTCCVALFGMNRVS